MDIILGGHDHLYFVSKGVTTWEGYDISKPSIGSEGDNGDILVVKSGTDFRELSELTLELEDTPPGSVRKKVIKAVHGERSLFISSSSGEVEWLNATGAQVNAMRSGLVCRLRRTCKKFLVACCCRYLRH